jgi:hypothetical protein
MVTRNFSSRLLLLSGLVSGKILSEGVSSMRQADRLKEIAHAGLFRLFLEDPDSFQGGQIDSTQLFFA